MKLNDIHNTILKRVSHHHKPTEAVRQNVSDGIGRSVSDAAFSSALLELHSRGLVTSYIYDHGTGGYAFISSPNDYSMNVLYWLVAELPG